MSGARPGSVPVAGSTRAWPAFPGQFGIRASGGSAGALPGITATASRCRSSRPIASRCDASRNARGAGGTPAVALRSSGLPGARGCVDRRAPGYVTTLLTGSYRVRRGPSAAECPSGRTGRDFRASGRATARARAGHRPDACNERTGAPGATSERRAAALLDTCA